MITANIKNANRYFAVNVNFKKAFEFLKTLDASYPDGPFESDGFRGNVLVFENLSATPDESTNILEAHRDYIDIHYVISGSEAIGYADIDTLEVSQEYIKEDDYLLLNGNMYEVYLNKGDFFIVYPEDAHAPARYAFDDCLKKAVVKIEI